MLKAEEVSVQSYATLGMVGQAFHIKRWWLFLLFFVLYKFYGFSQAVVGFFMVLILLSRIAPLRVKDKDGLIYYILMRLAFSFTKKVESLLSKGLSHLINILSLLLFLTLPLPSWSQQDPLTILKEDELRKLLKELETKEKILKQQENLIYGGEKELYIRGVNHFDYHPNLPILFVFDRKIKHVLMYTDSAKAVYEDNILFLGPPTHEDGRVFGFAVIFEDGNAYYFAGRKVSITDKQMQVGVYYRFRTPASVSIDTIIASFIKEKGRCPMDNEVISVEGRVYKFVKLKEKVVRDEDEVFCGGAVFKLYRL